MSGHPHFVCGFTVSTPTDCVDSRWQMASWHIKGFLDALLFPNLRLRFDAPRPSSLPLEALWAPCRGPYTPVDGRVQPPCYAVHPLCRAGFASLWLKKPGPGKSKGVFLHQLPEFHHSTIFHSRLACFSPPVKSRPPSRSLHLPISKKRTNLSLYISSSPCLFSSLTTLFRPLREPRSFCLTPKSGVIRPQGMLHRLSMPTAPRGTVMLL